jgi:hypothetical protein
MPDLGCLTHGAELATGTKNLQLEVWFRSANRTGSALPITISVTCGCDTAIVSEM